MPVITSAPGMSVNDATADQERPSTEEVGQGVLANMAEGLSNSIFGGASFRAGERLGSDLQAQGERFLSLEDANQQAKDAGVSVSGVGSSGISQSALDVMIDHQQHEQERAQLIQRSGQTGLLGFAERMVGDPMLLVPMGEGVGALESAGTSLAAKIGQGAVKGGVATAGIEAVNYPIQRYSGDDYTMMDSLRNVALGIGLGGVGGGAAHAIEDFQTRRSARLGALAAVADDRPVDISPFLNEPGRMNAGTVGTGEDLANALVGTPENPTTRDQALLSQFQQPAQPRPEVQAEMNRINTQVEEPHPEGTDELHEAVTNELADTKDMLAHNPAAMTELDEKTSTAPKDNDFLGALKEGVNCARMNGAP